MSAASRAAVSAATASALLFSAVSILSQLSLNSVCRMRSSGSQRDSVLTHAVTHEQKKRDRNSGTESACGCENPAANPLYSSESPWKASLSNLHTHEATGSSPVVSAKNHRNRLIPVIFFHNLQLFWMLNFCRFSKTHTLTHTGNKLYPRKWTRDFDPWPRSADTHLTHRVRSAAPVL